MRLELYQVPHLLVNSSTYLGSLPQPKYMELNVDLKNMRNIKLLLSIELTNYNYLKVIENGGKWYYYILDAVDYHNNNQAWITYKLDVIRTITERYDFDLDVRLTKYSGLMDSEINNKSYFWKNQDIKLSSEQLQNIHDIKIFTGHGDQVDLALSTVKWLYIWLQPKNIQKDERTNTLFQYKITQRLTGSVINVTSNDIPSKRATYLTMTDPSKSGWYEAGGGPRVYWPEEYIVGQIYYTTDTEKYYRFVETTRFANVDREFVLQKDYNGDEEWFLQNLKTVNNQYLPTSAYCIVLPTEEILIRDSSSNDLTWSANKFLHSILEGEADGSWIPNIIDLQLSNLPPFDLSEVDVSLEPELCIHTRNHTLPYLHGDVKKFSQGVAVENYDYIPALTTKLSAPLPCKTPIYLHDMINEDELVLKKYYLSMFEDRVEIDIPKLVSDNADKLYIYEDIMPGRTNVLLGFAPAMNTLEYLIHSPSTLTGTRDLTLPTFATSYSQYLANNKNFIKQAELSRDTQLQQGLINSASQVLGSSVVSLSLEGYNPANSLIKAGGAAINSLISYNAQKKQLGWSIDNMKLAPGNYKSASATASTLLTLNKPDYWIEEFKSNSYDEYLYRDVISELGYNYYDMRFKFSKVFQNMMNLDSSRRGFIQGRLTGIQFQDYDLIHLSYILNDDLNKGVNIYL